MPATTPTHFSSVLFCGKLDLLCTKRSSVGVWNTKYFQLLPRELVYFQAGGNDDYRQGVVLIERLNIFDEDEKSSFKVKSASGITLVLDADSQETKSMWLVAIRKQVQSIENMKLKVKTAPKEETNENAILVKDKIAQFYDDEWGASAIAGETEQYEINFLLFSSCFDLFFVIVPIFQSVLYNDNIV